MDGIFAYLFTQVERKELKLPLRNASTPTFVCVEDVAGNTVFALDLTGAADGFAVYMQETAKALALYSEEKA